MGTLISQLLSQHFPALLPSASFQISQTGTQCHCRVSSLTADRTFNLVWFLLSRPELRFKPVLPPPPRPRRWLNKQNIWQDRVGGTPALRVERATSGCNSNDHSFPPEHSFSFGRVIVVPPAPYKCCQSHVSWRREEDLLVTSRIKFLSDIKGCHCCLRHFWASFKGEEPACMISSPRYEGTLQSWSSLREHSAQCLSTRASFHSYAGAS